MPSAAFIDQTLDFLMNVIGFQELGRIDLDLAHVKIDPVKFQVLRFGNSNIKLKHETSADKPDAPRATSPHLMHYVTLRVKDIERIVTRLQSLDSKSVILVPPSTADTKQGANMNFAFFLVSPVGTQIEIFERRLWVGMKHDDVV